MVGLDNEIRLANILIVIAEGETEVDDLKQEIGNVSNFNPFALFSLFDQHKQGCTTVDDVYNKMREKRIVVMKEEVSKFFKHFLGKKDDKITFAQFLDLVVPKNHIRNFDQKNAAVFRAEKYEYDELEKNYRILLEIFEKEIKLLTLLDKLKAVLLKNTESNYRGLFNIIDIFETGIIEPDRMLSFLKRHKQNINEEDILAIFRRVNQGANGQISFKEFCSFMNYTDMPLSAKRAKKSSKSRSRKKYSGSPRKHSKSPKIGRKKGSRGNRTPRGRKNSGRKGKSRTSRYGGTNVSRGKHLPKEARVASTYRDNNRSENKKSRTSVKKGTDGYIAKSSYKSPKHRTGGIEYREETSYRKIESSGREWSKYGTKGTNAYGSYASKYSSGGKMSRRGLGTFDEQNGRSSYFEDLEIRTSVELRRDKELNMIRSNQIVKNIPTRQSIELDSNRSTRTKKDPHSEYPSNKARASLREEHNQRSFANGHNTEKNLSNINNTGTSTRSYYKREDVTQLQEIATTPSGQISSRLRKDPKLKHITPSKRMSVAASQVRASGTDYKLSWVTETSPSATNYQPKDDTSKTGYHYSPQHSSRQTNGNANVDSQRSRYSPQAGLHTTQNESYRLSLYNESSTSRKIRNELAAIKESQKSGVAKELGQAVAGSARQTIPSSDHRTQKSSLGGGASAAEVTSAALISNKDNHQHHQGKSSHQLVSRTLSKMPEPEPRKLIKHAASTTIIGQKPTESKTVEVVQPKITIRSSYGNSQKPSNPVPATPKTNKESKTVPQNAPKKPNRPKTPVPISRGSAAKKSPHMSSSVVVKPNNAKYEYGKSGASKKDLKIFVDIIKKIIVFCTKIEEIQCKLYRETDINILHLYRIADEKNKGYVLVEELWELFTSLNIQISQEELQKYLSLTIKEPSLNNNSRITFSDFMKSFTPINNSIQNEMFNSFIWSESTAKKATISEQATDLIGMIIELRRKLYEELSKELGSISFVSRRAILKEITSTNYNNDIQWEDLSNFMDVMNIPFFATDMIYVFREMNCENYRVITEKAYNDFFRLFTE